MSFVSPQPDAFFTAVSVLDSLIRSGMEHVVLSPGSRSAPLAYALAAASEAGVVTVHVRIDERSAGFTALGLAKSSGRPVGIVTTSGTAVGEILPAVMEANHSEVPLAVLSADRPPRLRGTGANQTTWQSGLFGVQVRASADLISYPEKTPGEQTVAFMDCLASLTGRDLMDWNIASPRPRGPVHINVAFDDPLTPEPRMRETLRSWAESLVGITCPAAPCLVDRTAYDVLEAGHHPVFRDPEKDAPRRTVVVAGGEAGEIARRFAEVRGLPLLAEPSSNARAGKNAMTAYRLLLDARLGEQIERVVLFGRPTLSRPVSRLLERTDVDCVIYLPRPVAWADPARRAERPVTSLSEAAAFAGTGAPGWLDEWRHADEKLSREVTELVQRIPAERGHLTGPALARETWAASAADGATLVAGSSNLIRDVDLLAAPFPVDPGRRNPKIYANRGLAGIDGTVATAAGISLDEKAPVRVLVGDLTFLHDAGSLLIGPGEPVPDLQILVFNDAGGGIFTTLEHGGMAREEGWEDAVERFFSTPHEARIQDLVHGYGHQYTLVEDLPGLSRALREPIRGIRVIEARGTRKDLDRLHTFLQHLTDDDPPTLPLGQFYGSSQRPTTEGYSKAQEGYREAEGHRETVENLP